MSIMGDIRLEILDTPEGRAYYPYGAWGMGYLVDARTERRLGAYVGRMPWIIGAFFMLQSLVRLLLAEICHLRMSDHVGVVVGFVTFLVFYYAILHVILRGRPRAAYRPSSEELLRLRLATRGRTAVVFAHWALLIIFGAFAAMFAIMFGGLARLLAVAAYVTLIVAVALSLRRIERLSD